MVAIKFTAKIQVKPGLNCTAPDIVGIHLGVIKVPLQEAKLGARGRADNQIWLFFLYNLSGPGSVASLCEIKANTLVIGSEVERGPH